MLMSRSAWQAEHARVGGELRHSEIAWLVMADGDSRVARLYLLWARRHHEGALSERWGCRTWREYRSNWNRINKAQSHPAEVRVHEHRRSANRVRTTGHTPTHIVVCVCLFVYLYVCMCTCMCMCLGVCVCFVAMFVCVCTVFSVHI